MMHLQRFTMALDQACRLADEIRAMPLDEVRETLLLVSGGGETNWDVATVLQLIGALAAAQRGLNPTPLAGAPFSVLESELRAAMSQADGDPSRTVFGQGVC